ncbi:MAG TPA: FAD-dependent oxidoreductase [Candidatus Saccharibacteria bacterium]|nr:FAD-dependent oxidoreductase [Candidatus Saccharibacteria bacterium]
MHITIVGGGFGGIKAALELAKDSKNQITLISDRPDFRYYPALYSSATGHSHLSSSVPLGEILANKDNIRVHIDEITTINPSEKNVTGKSGTLYQYDRCILALGTVTTYFGIKGLDNFSYGIKSETEIKQLKHRIYTSIAVDHKLDDRYIIIGAGPTGVELAGALGSYLKRLCKHYGVRDSKLRIELIEAAPRVLPRMSEEASARVAKRLKKLGVKVSVNKAVQSASKDGIIIDGKEINSQTVIWTSGVANHPFYKANAEHFMLNERGHVIVDEFMQAAPSIYVIGDNAVTKHAGLAQTALHDAIFVADNFKRERHHRHKKPYKPVAPPVVVPVGKRWAIFEWHGIRIFGWPAAMIRRAADFMGYSDYLPIGQALGVWRSSSIIEDDYFSPRSVNNI